MNTGADCHFLLQEIFLTQGSNLHLQHCRWILYHLSHQGHPKLKVMFCPMVFFEGAAVAV